MVRTKEQKKVGLALGSGGARGWAHIGVIQALLDAGVNVHYVAGTSIGALVGAVFASGKIETLKDIVLQLDWKQILHFLDITFPRSGLIDGKKLSDFAQTYVRKTKVEDLYPAFVAVSTDIATGEEITIDSGDTVDAVRASISIPGIFTPVKRGKRILVDGGLVNPVPVSVTRQMGAEIVIAVDLNHDILGKRGLRPKTRFDGEQTPQNRAEQSNSHCTNKFSNLLNERLKNVQFPVLEQVKKWRSKEALPNIFEVVMNSISVMEYHITKYRLEQDKPDIIIRPGLGYLGTLEFNRAAEAIEEGYQKTVVAMEQIQELLHMTS